MKNNIETPSYSIHEGGYHKEKHLMLKMQNNFQDKFLDSILFDPDKTDRTEFFELKEALELVRFTEFLLDFISKDISEMDAIVDYNYRITQGITVDELLKMSDENIKKALLDLHKRMYNLQ